MDADSDRDKTPTNHFRRRFLKKCMEEFEAEGLTYQEGFSLGLSIAATVFVNTREDDVDYVQILRALVELGETVKSHHEIRTAVNSKGGSA